MQSSPEVNELATALVQARTAFPAIHKSSVNPQFNSRYASLGAIMDAVLPVLLANGITVMQGGGQSDDAGAEIVTRLQHVSGQWIQSTIRMPLTPTRKRDGTIIPINAQSAGSAQTYGQRYGLAAILGVVADDDDDGNAASAPPKPVAKAKPSAEKMQELEMLAADPRWTETQATKLRDRAKKADADQLDTLIQNAIASLATKETAP